MDDCGECGHSLTEHRYIANGGRGPYRYLGACRSCECSGFTDPETGEARHRPMR